MRIVSGPVLLTSAHSGRRGASRIVGGTTAPLRLGTTLLLYNSGMVKIVWEFLVRPGREEEFELFYNGEGLWAILFRKSPDYFGTKLMRDMNTPRRYLTVDKWETAESFPVFKKTVEFEYTAIDRKCEELTENERLVGVFEEI